METAKSWTTGVLLALWLVSIVSGNFLNVKEVRTESNHSIVLDVWKNLDDNVVGLTDTILKYTYPYLTRFAVTSELSTECTGSLLKMLKGVKNQEDWAFKMLDASGKAFSGLYSGTTSTFGSFDQCLKISVPDPYAPKLVQFQGQYCTVDFKILLPDKKRYNRIDKVIEPLNNFTAKSSVIRRITLVSKHLYYMALRIGICIPSACPTEDLNKLITHLSDQIGMIGDVNRCEIKANNVFKWDQVVIIFVFAIFGLLLVIGTAVEVIPTFFKTQQSPKDYGLWREIIMSFSVESNVTNFLNTDNVSEDALPAIHGLKFLSMTWVIIGHAYLQINFHLLREADVVFEEIKKFAFQAVINAYMAVDTFFFITGLLVCYITLSIVDHVGQKNFNPIIFILRRVWRLLPSTMMVIGLTILLPLFGSGPLWHDTIDVIVQNCRENWWYNALFINNFLAGNKTCLPQTWYTATDMQLYFLALIFLLLLFRKSVYAIVFGIFLIIASIASTAAVNIIMDLPPTVLQSEQDPAESIELFDLTQFKPHTHVSSYAIGLLMGYLIITARKTPFRVRYHVQYFLWLASIAIAMSVLYGTYEWNNKKEASFWESVAYSSLFRTGWVLSISWMTFACCTGRGGVINRILAWKALIPLSRLTFTAYLLHCLVIWFYVGNLRGTVDGQQMFAVWSLISCIVISYAFSFVCYTAFEIPLQRLEKLLLLTIFKSKLPQSKIKGTKEGSDSSMSTSETSVGKLTLGLMDKETKIVTIHTLDNLCNNPNVIFTGYGRRLNDEVAKDGTDGSFNYLNR